MGEREVGTVKWFNDKKVMDLFHGNPVRMFLCITHRSKPTDSAL